MVASSNPGLIVARKMRACAEAATDGATIRRSAMLVKGILEASVASATGGDGRLSNLRGAKLSVQFKASDTEAEFRARGPWGLVENGAKPHQIRPRRGTVLNIPGIGFRRRANHPGTKGSKPWSRGVNKAKPVAAKEARSQAVRAIGKAFKS